MSRYLVTNLGKKYSYKNRENTLTSTFRGGQIG
jgi:hypothetical protein